MWLRKILSKLVAHFNCGWSEVRKWSCSPYNAYSISSWWYRRGTSSVSMLRMQWFNSLNRTAALHIIRVVCPMIAVYAINTYRQTARLFIVGGKKLVSAEGTTQGDPLAMALCALSIQPLITCLQSKSNSKQCWFADDASGTGSVGELKKWWDALNLFCPELGTSLTLKSAGSLLYPKRKHSWGKASKTRLLMSPQEDTSIWGL